MYKLLSFFSQMDIYLDFINNVENLTIRFRTVKKSDILSLESRIILII